MPSTDGHAAWVRQIQGAKRSIHLAIYHLTDQSVIQALIDKLNNAGPGFDLRVLVDGKSMAGGYLKALQPLLDAGVALRGSSPAFSIMHEKAMVVDSGTALITAINLTNTSDNTRDFGVVTADAGVISEINAVFEADWLNAANGTGATPALANGNLAWSPVNSHDKLIQFIDGAVSTLVMQVESLSHPEMIAAFARAAARGVQVQVLVPMCVAGNPLFNYPALVKLQGLGVQVHVMAPPASFNQPYMHSKMMVADSQTIYIGSINFSMNSIVFARELGVLFFNPQVAARLAGEFAVDWGRSVIPAATPVCPRSGYMVGS